jgi:hypothetical protein
LGSAARAELVANITQNVGSEAETSGAVQCFGFSGLTSQRADGVLHVPLD